MSGETKRTINGFFNFSADNIDEIDEVLTVTVSEDPDNSLPAGVTISSTADSDTYTIVDDDATIASLVATSDTIFTEQTPSDTAAVTVRLSRRLYAGEQLLVPFETGADSGINTHDQNNPSYSLSVSGNGVTATNLTNATSYVRFTGHDTDVVRQATVTLTPTNHDDGNTEDGYVDLELPTLSTGEWTSSFTNVGGGGAPHGTSHTVRLTYGDDDDAPITGAALAFSPSALTVMGDGSTSYTVAPSAAPTGTVTVGIASDNADVTVSPASLSFDATNWRQAKTVTVSATEDNDGVADRAVLTHSASGGGYDGVSGTLAVLVTNGTAPANCGPSNNGFIAGCVWITGGPAVTEGGTAMFTVHAHPPPAKTLYVNFKLADAGFRFLKGRNRIVHLQIAAGQTSVSHSVETVDDSTDEPDGYLKGWMPARTLYPVGSPDDRSAEAYYLQLGAPEARVLVRDNDGAPPPPPPRSKNVSFTLSATSIMEDAADPWVDVNATLSQAHDSLVPLPYAVCIYSDARRSIEWSQTGEGDNHTAYDYRVWKDGVLQFAACVSGSFARGVTSSSQIRIQVLDDSHEDSGERIRLKLQKLQARHWDRLDVGLTGPLERTLVIYNDEGREPGSAGVDPALVAQVRGYAAETHEGQAHVDRWKRVLVAFGAETYPGLTPMTAAEAQVFADRGWSRWDPVVVALKKLERDTPDLPAVTVAGGSAVTEGGSATFTVTATPAPAAALDVSVSVTADGDYGVTAGTQTVSIPTTGSATLTLATTDDATDEADGSVTATVAAGTGYTVGDPASGTVAVQDDDGAPPQPAVTVSAGSAVTEGGGAAFTLTATPAPASPLAVSVSVTAEGDYGVTAGTRTVNIPTTGSATLTLATTGDAIDEADGSVTATVAGGTGYTVGDPASGTVAVRDDDEPVVTIAAGSAVTEGGDAVFTLTASPAPAAALAVGVTVAAAGDYGISAGKRTVSIPTTGSATLTLATADDGTDEPDGSVTATVEDGTGYSVGASASGTVAIRDDDLPPPVVTIAAKAASVTEGGDAAFTLSADRAPAADLTVRLAVSETGAGDHVAAADEGPATAVIAKGETEAAFTVATVNDAVDEPDGTATVTVQAGTGYTVGDPSSGTVTVTDDDITVLPSLSVADETAEEGEDWLLTFTVRLSAPSAEAEAVRVDTRASTPVSAEPGHDYWPLRDRRLVFRAGETEKPVQVLVFDDSHDEEAETFEVVLSDAKGAVIGDGVAVGTIVNDDPMPAAFLARFGRTVAEQALDGIAGRMSAPRTAGMQGAIAGQAVNFDTPSGSGGPDHGSAGSPDGEAALAMAEIARSFGSNAGGPGSWSGTGPGHGGIGDGFGHDTAGPGLGAGGTGFGQTPAHSRTMTAREALLGSSFSLTGETDGSGGSMAFWGRASQGSFDGREGTFSLDGAVTTGMLGADYARGRWLIGLALTQSEGEGDYRDTRAMPRPPSQICSNEPELCDGAVRMGDGKVEASLTAAIPYGALKVSERLKLWGAAGYGTGEVTLKTAMGGSYGADTSWSMAAAGLRGELLEAPAEGSGPALAATSDALWARTSSEKTRDLAASDSDVTRLRVGLEGSYHVALDGGGSLVPKLEVGARHDGGDAETGFGVELGGGVKWTDPGMGLSLDLSGRTLIAHGDDDLKDRGFSAALAWDPAPATKRGASLNLRQDFGGQSRGGLDALFRPETLDDRTGSEATSRWAVEAAYGLPVFGGRWTGSPHVGLGLATGARDYSLGWRLAPEAANAPDLSFGVRATRRESDAQAAEHTVGVEVRARW